MKRDLSHKIYKDKIIQCRNVACRRIIGKTAFDSQVLLLESGLACFSFFSWQCSCGKNSSWQSPLLPEEAETPDALFPDEAELQSRIKKLSRVGVSKLHNKFRARASIKGKTEHLGLYLT